MRVLENGEQHTTGLGDGASIGGLKSTDCEILIGVLTRGRRVS